MNSKLHWDIAELGNAVSLLEEDMSLFDIISRFEKLIICLLSIMMAIVIAFATLDLGWLLAEDIYKEPRFLLSVQQLMEIFGMFMLVLIGIELLETIRVYHQDRVIRVEVVVIVAIIAIARKAIILDYKKLTSFTLLELGAIILALAAAYYLLKRSETEGLKEQEE
jgi:uncharacterized membrane protein (DUF373 family)